MQKILVSVAIVAILVITFFVNTYLTLPFPIGMNTDWDRSVTLTEWLSYHETNPEFYGGYDKNGYIDRESNDYYEREFKRVDCDQDLRMNASEYSELRWNMRWCDSKFSPQ